MERGSIIITEEERKQHETEPYNTKGRLGRHQDSLSNI